MNISTLQFPGLEIDLDNVDPGYAKGPLMHLIIIYSRVISLMNPRAAKLFSVRTEGVRRRTVNVLAWCADKFTPGAVISANSPQWDLTSVWIWIRRL